MVCSNCGTESSPGDKFCEKCGRALPAEQPIVSEEAVFEAHAPRIESPQRPPAKATPRGEQVQGEYKNCPFCAEKILAKAMKCKHCGSMLQEAPAPAASNPPEVSAPPSRPIEKPISLIDDEDGLEMPVSNGLAWGLTGVLLFSLVLDFTLGDMASMVITFILNTILVIVDNKQLKKANRAAPNVLWLVIIPVYLYKRAKALGHGLSYFWSWIVVFIIYLLISMSVTSPFDNLQSTGSSSYSTSTTRAASVPGAHTLTIPDFIVDFNNYVGEKVVLSGVLIAMNETVILYEELGSMNTVFVDISRVDNETKKNILRNCGSGCNATLLGTPAQVSYQKGLMLLQVVD